MTLSIVDFSADGSVRWSSLGAPPLLAIRKNPQSIEVLTCPGTPLGSRMHDLATLDFRLDQGDMLAVFTDGFNELQMSSGRALGLRRVNNLLNDIRNFSPTEGVKRLEQMLASARGKTALADDLTVLLLSNAPVA
jgi:serine phosphatase RsbU (regulator of sigma subunit)